MTREDINNLYKKAVDNHYNKSDTDIESSLLDAVQIGLQYSINGEVIEKDNKIVRID